MKLPFHAYAQPLAALLAGLSLASAGAQNILPSQPGQPTGSLAHQYVSSPYVLTRWEEGGRVVALGQPPITLQFTGRRVGGFSGCNSYSAPYIQRLDSLRFGPIAGTLKGCPRPQLQREMRYLAALSRVNTVRMQGQNMVLFAGRDRLTFSPQADSAAVSPASALPVGTWRLRSVTDKNVTTFQPKSRIQFTIAPDGSASGNDGCNRFQGKVSLSGARLRWAGPVVSTRMLCQGNPQSLYDLLGYDQSGAGAAFVLDEGGLSFTRDDGQVWHFARQGE